jgi:hypothetical protein
MDTLPVEHVLVRNFTVCYSTTPLRSFQLYYPLAQ